MKKYELLLVLPGTLDEKESEVKSGEILNLIKNHAEETELRILGKNRLAYPIKQIRYGYFYTIIFNAETNNLKVIQEKLNIMRDLLRAIVSNYNPHWANNQKISYATSETGVTTMLSEETAKTITQPTATKIFVAPATAKTNDKPVDLEEIDKKLDEILGGNMIINV